MTSKVSLGQNRQLFTALISAVPTQPQPSLSQMPLSPKVAVTKTIIQQLFSSPGNLSKAKIHHKTAPPEVLLAPPPQPPPSTFQAFTQLGMQPVLTRVHPPPAVAQAQVP